MDGLMIGRLLQVHYPQEHGIDSEGVVVDIVTRIGLVELSDSKACDNCQKSRPQRAQCDRVNLRVNTSDKSIVIVDFEKYVNQFDNTAAAMKDRCDYILVDASEAHNKIAFCDLTCSEEKYVNPNDGKYPLGKRAKAVMQMMKSLESLLVEPLLANYILTFPEKVCLFGWRDYAVPADVTPKRGNAARNMVAFMNTPSAKSGTLNQVMPVVDHGFKFVQVKYPTVYQW